MTTTLTPENQKNLNELELIRWIKSIGSLAESIRNVHDHAIYFSSEDIPKDLLGSLYYVRILEDYIRKIEKDNED